MIETDGRRENRLSNVINTFREDTLGLAPLSLRSGPSVVDRLKIPWTYCWSEGLIPKPDDWRNTTDISVGFSFFALYKCRVQEGNSRFQFLQGFYFLDLATVSQSFDHLSEKHSMATYNVTRRATNPPST